MKPKSLLLLTALLALFSLSACGTSELAKKNEDRIAAQRYKISQLRTEDADVLSQIDDLLKESETLINRADKNKSDEERASLLLDAAESILVDANTKRLYLVRKNAYDASQQAYIQRSGRIQKLKSALQTQIPAIMEAN